MKLTLLLLATTSALHHKNPLAVSRGGKGGVGLEQLEDLVDVVESQTSPLEDPADEDDDDVRPDDAWRTLVQVWK